MIRALTTTLLALAISGCATPVAKRYYASCVQAGHDPAACEMRALEINQQALQGFSASMNSAAASFKSVNSPVQNTLHCVSTSAADGARTTTTCH